MRARSFTFTALAVSVALSLGACAGAESPSTQADTAPAVSDTLQSDTTPTAAPTTDATAPAVPPPARYNVTLGKKKPGGTVTVSDTFWCEDGKPVSGVWFEAANGGEPAPYGDANIGTNVAPSVRITHWVKAGQEYLASLGCEYGRGDHEWADEYQEIILGPTTTGHTVICRPETCTVDGVVQPVRFVRNVP
jgi:hypothetical protein